MSDSEQEKDDDIPDELPSELSDEDEPLPSELSDEDEPTVFDRKQLQPARIKKAAIQAAEGVGGFANAGGGFLASVGTRITDALKAASCLMDKNSDGPCDVASLIFVASVILMCLIIFYQLIIV